MCIICRSKRTGNIKNKLRHNIKRKVLRCKNCGFVFLESGKSSSDFHAGTDYRKLHKPNLNKKVNCQEFFNVYAPFQKEIIQKIKHILRPNMKVLDVGCSTGHFLVALKEKVKTRVGLELSKEHADFVKKNLDFKVYREPIEEAEIKEGPFDLITCLQTLEHVDDPEKFLKGIIKNLKPGGYVFLETPNIDDVLLGCYKVPAYSDFYYREPHLWYFSAPTLNKLLDKVGLEGKTKTVQSYNFLNHLHWLLANGPQDGFEVGNLRPLLVSHDGVNVKAKKDLNNFIKKVDEDYKAILMKHGIAENLSFLGKIKK